MGLHAAHGGEDVLVTAAGVAAGHAASHPVLPSNAKLESVIYMGIIIMRMHVISPDLWMFLAAQRLDGVTVCSTMELSPSTAILHAVEEG